MDFEHAVGTLQRPSVVPPNACASARAEIRPLDADAASAQVDVWVERIKAAIRKSFAGTMEAGRVLIDAKAALPHGAWLEAVKKAHLDKRSAQVWMRVARNPRFANASRDSLLPASPVTLDAIARLPEGLYQSLLAQGVINPAVTANTVREILKALKQAEDEERIVNLAPERGKVRTLVGDPGWARMSRGTRSCPYATMSQAQLLALPVPEWLFDDAHVYWWILDSELENALALFRHWGIAFKQILTWNKIHASGKSRMGLGHYFRNNCEHVLFGVRGKLDTRVRSISKSFTAAVVGEHSAKPDEFYEIVRTASYPPFGEVFGRKPREGFINLFQEAQPASKAAA